MTDPHYKPGLIKLSLLGYADNVTTDQKNETKPRFLALKADCLRNAQTYNVSIVTGAQNSGERAAHQLDHGVIVTFRWECDRNYYVGQPVIENSHYRDPAYQGFKEFVLPLLHPPTNPTELVVFEFKVDSLAE